MNRKDFFRKAMFGGGLFFLAPAVVNALNKPGSDNNFETPMDNDSEKEFIVDLGSDDYKALASIGGYAYAKKILIIHTSSGYVALSKSCTHWGCTVAYDKTNNDIECHCHGSKFNLDGSVVKGPAKKALKTYNVKVDGTMLTITQG